MRKKKESIKTSRDLMARSGAFPAAPLGVPAGCNNEQGIALILALVMLALLGMLGALATSTSITEIRIGGNYREAQRVYYLTDQGQEQLSTQLDIFKPDQGVSPGEDAGDCPLNKNYDVADIPSLDPNLYTICYNGAARAGTAAVGSGTAAEMSGGGPSTTYIILNVIGRHRIDQRTTTEFATQTIRSVLK